MARKKKKEVEVDYVVERLPINYTMPKGLAHMLASASNKPLKEVWCQLSDMANICAHRLSTRGEGHHSSWTQSVFPETEVKLRIDMNKYEYRHWSTQEKSPARYEARIKISGYANETFTQAQVNDYITETILLGDDEEATQQ